MGKNGVREVFENFTKTGNNRAFDIFWGRAVPAVRETTRT